MADVFKFSVVSDFASYAWSDDSLAYVLVEMTPNFPPAEGQVIRAPVDIVLVLDVSNSMDRPDKYPLLREAVCTLIDALVSEDHVAIILFSASSSVLWPLSPSTSLKQQRAELLAKMDRSPVMFGPRTFLAPGLMSAYEQFESRGRSSTIRRVFCLTDGELHDADRCSDFLKALQAQQTEIHMYGFGSEFDAEQLTQLIGKIPGSFVKPLVDTRDVNETFELLAFRAADAVARNLSIKFDLAQGTVPGDIFQFRPQENWLGSIEKSKQRNIGSVERSRIYSWLLELRLPSSEGAETTQVGTMRVQCFFEPDGLYLQEIALVVSRSPKPGELSSRVVLVKDLLIGLREDDNLSQIRRTEASLVLCRAENRDPALISALEHQLSILRNSEHNVAKNGADSSFALPLSTPYLPPLTRKERLYIKTDRRSGLAPGRLVHQDPVSDVTDLFQTATVDDSKQAKSQRPPQNTSVAKSPKKTRRASRAKKSTKGKSYPK